MSKREKASRTYRDSSDNGVEIFGSTQGSGATVIFQFTASSSPAKRAVVESSVRRHRYNYRDNSDAEYGGEEFFASPSADKYDKDLRDVEVVENSIQKSREEGLVQQVEVEVLPRRAPSRRPLLDPPANSRVRSRPPRRAPLRGPQSAPPTNITFRSRSYQPARRVPNTPCPLQYVRRDKSQLTIMIAMKITESMLIGVPVPVG